MAWSHSLSGSRIALASAAWRHVTDAAYLTLRSPVQAWYLAGYGPECIRKAALTVAMDAGQDAMDKAIGHGFKNDPEIALGVFCSLDPLATRYALQGWRTRFQILSRWSEQVRYARSDEVTVPEARKMVTAATELVETVLTALWADGRLPSLGDLVEGRS